MGTELLHTADTHLGYRQYHKPEREEDFRQAFETVVDEAINHDVDAVVHAGDIFNRSRPSISALSDLVEQLKRLADAGIDFCTIVGNHDGTRDRQWPEFLEDLGLAVYLGYEGYIVGDVTLYGQDFIDEGQRNRLDYDFHPPETDTAFLVGHGLFTPFPHGNWDVEELIAKSTVSFDAFLLGDDHKPQIDDVEGTPITYPGSTERTAADQRDKRGYNLVRVGANGSINIDHETIETRHFHFIDIEMEDGAGVEYVLDEVEEEPVPEDSIVIVTLTGDGKRVPPADVEQAGLRHGALAVRVNDRREFEDVDPEFEDVEFAEPDEAVRERKRDLPLSPVADELEQLARDVEGVPQSNLKDVSEERVEDFVEERDLDEFTEVPVPSRDDCSETESESVEASSDDSSTDVGVGDSVGSHSATEEVVDASPGGEERGSSVQPTTGDELAQTGRGAGRENNSQDTSDEPNGIGESDSSGEEPSTNSTENESSTDDDEDNDDSGQMRLGDI